MYKKLLSDWSLWMLVIFNAYTLYEYEQNPSEFTTLVFLYWAQSVMIGLANFFDILTLPALKPGNIVLDGKPSDEIFSGRGCTGIFFLFHFGGFCLGHLIFLFIKVDGHVDFSLFKIGFGIICIAVAMDFIRKKIRQRYEEPSLGKTLFLPYLRVIPMHLMFIIPQFVHVKDAVTFIVLKIVMDIVMHIATSGY